ncbi:MAG: DeoR family transcriptional regulator, partial [Clostridia bacterium]|nr:DeoR family transcriptional regulator [Clostridia bacterium]
MYQKERFKKIMDILNKYSYVTVKYLTYELGYSTATLNRDLNVLEEKKLITRS